MRTKSCIIFFWHLKPSERLLRSAGAKEQLQLYYEQLKQSILENDSYVDALLELSDVIYTVNLTKDALERRIVLNGKEQKSRELFMDYPLPCSYQDYCWEYEKKSPRKQLPVTV